MRISRTFLAVAVSAVAAFGAVATVAQAQPAPAASTGASVTDTEIAAYARALGRVTEISRALNGAAPTEAQRGEMVKAVTDAGLTAERFNAIATATASDPVLKARIGVAVTPASPAGSVGAGVSDAELSNFAKAMKDIRAIGASNPPTADQVKAQQEAVKNAGLTAERFNAISTASSIDQHLRARLSLAEAKLGG
jgi:hypothetical protein